MVAVQVHQHAAAPENLVRGGTFRPGQIADQVFFSLTRRARQFALFEYNLRAANYRWQRGVSIAALGNAEILFSRRIPRVLHLVTMTGVGRCLLNVPTLTALPAMLRLAKLASQRAAISS